MVLDFFKRRREARAEQEAEAQRNRKAELQAGEFGTALAGAVDAFIGTRARPTVEGMWGVFVRRVEDALKETTGSPIDAVRIEAKLFMTELGKFQDMTPGVCANALPEWVEAAGKVGVEDHFDWYVSHKASELYLEFFQRTTTYAGDLVMGLEATGHKAVTTSD